MIEFRRRNVAWLVTLGLLIGFALLATSTTLAPLIQLVLLGILGVATGISLFRFRPVSATNTRAKLTRTPLRQRMSPTAKEAKARAETRGGTSLSGLDMVDIGLIAVQTSSEGMAMRRTRSVSKDDDGVRPYVTIHVDPLEADRNAVIRFEMNDHYGQPKYVHELKAYLRDGEMNLMAEHHLPLAGNDSVTGAGDWELRVFLDGQLVGLHSFTLAPSVRERMQRLSRQSAPESTDKGNTMPPLVVIDEAPQEKPRSLQELLEPPPSTPESEENVRRRANMARRRREE